MKFKATLTLLSFYFLTSHIIIGQSYWITNLHIIEVESGNVLPLHHIEIEKGKIKSVTPDLNKVTGETIEGNGKYVIPGLRDMHVHLDMIGESSLPLFLYHGITGVRDMGGAMKAITELKASADAPDILSAGAILESDQFYQVLHMLLGEDFTKSRVPFGDAPQIGNLVDSLVASGADFIKIRTIENPEAFEALAKACRERGISFAGHVPPTIDLLTAVKAGLASIEHLDYTPILGLDEQEKQELASSISREKTFLTPTLIASHNYRLKPAAEVWAFVEDTFNLTYSDRRYISSKLLENWALQSQLTQLEGPQDWLNIITELNAFGKQLAEEGTPLMAGTDAGAVLVIPGKSLHEELELMVENLGISNLMALQAATLHPALFLGLMDEGTIRKGAVADLVLLDKNPLENISHTQTISMVIKGGKIYAREERERILREISSKVEYERKGYVNAQLEHFNSSLKKLMGNAPSSNH